MFFQAYPVKIGGVSRVELQAIGSSEGPPSKGKNCTTSARID
jgi:hypothetical protein